MEAENLRGAELPNRPAVQHTSRHAQNKTNIPPDKQRDRTDEKRRQNGKQPRGQKSRRTKTTSKGRQESDRRANKDEGTYVRTYVRVAKRTAQVRDVILPRYARASVCMYVRTYVRVGTAGPENERAQKGGAAGDMLAHPVFCVKLIPAAAWAPDVSSKTGSSLNHSRTSGDMTPERMFHECRAPCQARVPDSRQRGTTSPITWELMWLLKSRGGIAGCPAAKDRRQALAPNQGARS